MSRKSPDYERARQNLIAIRAAVQSLVDDGQVALALTATEKALATVHAIRKIGDSPGDTDPNPDHPLPSSATPTQKTS